MLNPEDKKQQAVLDRYREAAAEFATGNMPPTMTGYWLLKQSHVSAGRTSTDLGITLAWLTKQYEANPRSSEPMASGRTAPSTPNWSTPPTCCLAVSM